MENLKDKPKPEEKMDKKVLQEELARLEQEYNSGAQLLQTTQAQVLRIEGAIKTLRALLTAQPPSKN